MMSRAGAGGPRREGPPGSLAADTDRLLAESLIAGRPLAFESFVDRFAPLILNFGRRMCGQRHDAEEVLQETLLKAYVSLKDLREPGALRAWVYRVAANACLKMRRRARAAPERAISLDEVLPRPGEEGRPPEIPDWSDVPLDRLLQGEMRQALERAVLDLPKDFRVVLLLRDQEGFSTRETASILGISETLAKVRLHRARLVLRKAMEAYLSGRPRAGSR